MNRIKAYYIPITLLVNWTTFLAIIPKQGNSEAYSRSRFSTKRTRQLSGLGAFPDGPREGPKPVPHSAMADLRAQGATSRIETDPWQEEGVYIISVAARILEMHPQTLRKYERAGLVNPSRTVGLLRLYSEEDITRLRLIKQLVVDLGLNVAGVQLIMEVFNNLLRIRNRLPGLETKDAKDFLEETVDELFELLRTHLPGAGLHR